MNNFNIEELKANIELYKFYLNKLKQNYEQKKQYLNNEIEKNKILIEKCEDKLFRLQDEFFAEKISKLSYALATNEAERTIEDANEELQDLNKKLAKVKKNYIAEKRKIQKRLITTQNELNKLIESKEQER